MLKSNMLKNLMQYISPSPTIRYGYWLYIPKKITSVQVILWGHGSTPNEIPYLKINEFVKYSLLNIMKYCDDLGLVAIMPILPRECDSFDYPYFKFDSQIMTKEVMMSKFMPESTFYNRPDLEIIKIISATKMELKSRNIIVQDKIIIGGISAGATMANRFSILYPELIEISALLISGIFTYPTNKINELLLEYPFGISNIIDISTNRFEIKEFKKIHHFLFVGGQDNKPQNDILRFESNGEKNIDVIKQIIGDDSVDRTIKYANYLRTLSMDVELIIDQNLGHNINGEILDSTFSWIKNIIMNRMKN